MAATDRSIDILYSLQRKCNVEKSETGVALLKGADRGWAPWSTGGEGQRAQETVRLGPGLEQPEPRGLAALFRWYDRNLWVSVPRFDSSSYEGNHDLDRNPESRAGSDIEGLASALHHHAACHANHADVDHGLCAADAPDRAGIQILLHSAWTFHRGQRPDGDPAQCAGWHGGSPIH